MISLTRLLILTIAIILLIRCDTTPDKETKPQRELTPLEKLKELSKAAVILKVYSIIEADPSSGSARPTLLPSVSASIKNIETGEIYQSHIAESNLNIFFDVPAGGYLLYDLTYDDPRVFPLINLVIDKINDKRIKLSAGKGNPKNSPLYLYVKSKTYQYGGDFSVVFGKSGARTAPADFENEIADMKKGSELVLARYPHSRWAKEALKVLGITAGDY